MKNLKHTPAIPGHSDRLWIENTDDCSLSHSDYDALKALSMVGTQEKQGENFISFVFGPSEYKTACEILLASGWTFSDDWTLKNKSKTYANRVEEIMDTQGWVVHFGTLGDEIAVPNTVTNDQQALAWAERNIPKDKGRYVVANYPSRRRCVKPRVPARM